MASYALDTHTRQIKDVAWFLLNRDRKAVCPLCDHPMELRAEKTTDKSTHLWHGRNAYCPSIPENRIKYESLAARALDKEQGLRLRQEVIENLYNIYMSCNGIVGGLKIGEFKQLLNLATEKGIWDYQGLKLNYVPYVLLTFHEMFYAKDSKIRNERYFIVLEPNIKYLDDLWNDSRAKQYIWKVSPKHGILEKIAINEKLDPEPKWFKEFAHRIVL
ncbi:MULTISPECIES: hypothetical protein [unclassified Acinetobacter]|uniref:hypothetical protein n=1 Tax=unclassified Acinetobacter TaxID=196816 RepID=UPI0002CE1C00|nr:MULTISPECIES: hypothetical protein [unclassified Acinetobacter]ENU29100.1 hypothetical protein F991_03231 [Acinetobacter sp. CIP-A165]MCH7351277.1 hypothetical protein [Acinetobacter sp. NIPH 2023]MCH7359130.1 hypothetical protein [Acinetobacter sp. NIPH 2024]